MRECERVRERESERERETKRGPGPLGVRLVVAPDVRVAKQLADDPDSDTVTSAVSFRSCSARPVIYCNSPARARAPTASEPVEKQLTRRHSYLFGSTFELRRSAPAIRPFLLPGPDSSKLLLLQCTH